MGKMSTEEIKRQIEQLQLQLENSEAIELIEDLKTILSKGDVADYFDEIKNQIIKISSKFGGTKPGRKAGRPAGSTGEKKPIDLLGQLTSKILGFKAGRLSPDNQAKKDQAKPIVKSIVESKFGREINAALLKDEQGIEEITKEYAKQAKTKK